MTDLLGPADPSDNPIDLLPTSIPDVSDSRLREIALGIIEERIFTSAHIPPRDNVRYFLAVFTPLSMLTSRIDNSRRRDHLLTYLEGVGLIWQWRKFSTGSLLPGYPTFISMEVLNKPQSTNLHQDVIRDITALVNNNRLDEM